MAMAACVVAALGFLDLDAAFDNTGFLAFAGLDEESFLVFGTSVFWDEPGFLDNDGFLVLGNAVFLDTGFWDNAGFLVSGGVCFLVLGAVDFFTLGFEVLVATFFDFSRLVLERLFFDIGNLLIA